MLFISRLIFNFKFMETINIIFNYGENNLMKHLLKALDKVKLKYTITKIWAANNHDKDIEIKGKHIDIVNFFKQYKNPNNKKYTRNK